MRRFNWGNIPIPEGHVILLVVGVALHIWHSLELNQATWLRHVFGWPILLMGILLIARGLVVVNDINIEKPVNLITTGPYAFSRNPMYLAWTMIYLAIALLVNTWWLIVLLPVLILYTHYFVVAREEEQLERLFGEEYRQYRAKVRRYL
jgi:protein-S-isoprenylcysteine O-methyltransferase Ste14